VEVRERLVTGQAGAALVAESRGAALLVLRSRRAGRRRLRRSLRPEAREALASATSPVLFVG
jgi:nucleotide-binding universal stress UspA family protein